MAAGAPCGLRESSRAFPHHQAREIAGAKLVADSGHIRGLDLEMLDD
jgi:hypothetical protein